MLMIYFAIFFQRDCSDELEYHLFTEMNSSSNLKRFLKTGRWSGVGHL